MREKAAALGRRPRVFFEEWDSPLISGICWVDELVEIAGGDPLFPALRKESLAKNRIVIADEVAARDPEVIIASWCGKAMKKRTIVERPGWDRVSAVRADHIYEIKSTYILQPGPAALTRVARLHVHRAGVRWLIQGSAIGSGVREAGAGSSFTLKASGLQRFRSSRYNFGRPAGIKSSRSTKPRAKTPRGAAGEQMRSGVDPRSRDPVNRVILNLASANPEFSATYPLTSKRSPAASP